MSGESVVVKIRKWNERKQRERERERERERDMNYRYNSYRVTQLSCVLFFTVTCLMQ